MSAQTRECFIVVVHHGNSATTQQCIESIAANTVSPRGVVVIDHASSPLQLPKSLSVQLIRPKTNAGFAAGVNIGLGALTSQASAQDIIIVLNNDVVLRRDAVQTIMGWWKVHSQDAIAGLTLEEDGTIIHGGGRVNKLTGRATLITDQALNDATKLDYVHGAGFCAPYGVFLQTKGVPDHYFLYWEDTLLGTRAQKIGIPLCTIPRVVASHINQSTNHVSNKTYYLVRNGARFMQEELSLPWRITWTMLNTLRLHYHRAKKSQHSQLVAQALRDGKKRTSGIKP